ncbi:hypothetical protein O1R50_02675 [Glycomyces luteolus]|uniref:Glycosyl transferase n=1 Tax=Glycomyces luteolus TaxID=2670330 RepID=A0A9X3P552_9ACTN|nr:hypothetical protein [Glycomyces luteolus]MDA1358507.1 hypothetical protein [Glycomyces luteolus]
MIEVLLISGGAPPAALVADTVAKLTAAGGRVRYAGSVPDGYLERDLAGADLAETHKLPRSNPRRAARLPFGERVWIRSRKDQWLLERAARAHVIAALDDGGVYTVWQLAQRNRTAKAVNGFAPAIDAVRELAAHGGPPEPGPFRAPASLVARDFGRAAKDLPAAAVRLASSRRVMNNRLGAKLWRLPLRIPGVPEGLRIAIGKRVAEAMVWARRHADAEYVLAQTASKTSDPETKAQLLDEAVKLAADRGVNPKYVDPAVAARLVLADRDLAAGNLVGAASHLKRAFLWGFHRVIHIDQLSTKLSTDTAGFIKPFHDSQVMRQFATPRGRRLPAAPPPTGRPVRLLVMTSANDNFLGHILGRYRNHPDVEVRYLDLATHSSLKRIAWSDTQMILNRLGHDDGYAALAEDLLRPYLDWADTVFLDWCVGPAAMLTTVDPGDTRIVVRLHSYEAFTRWPLLVDFSRIDDLVFVADHVRDLAKTLVPQLRGPLAPRMPMVHNAMELAGFAREKTADARFNLGLVGVSQVAKDPLWALEVLRLLRAEDERYRLLVVGGDMNPNLNKATRKYFREYEKELEPLVGSGAVLRLGPTDDVAGKLTDVGFILSSSVREGCHVGLMEGAASGAVPVVRDWPFYAGKAHSARTLYPEGWVVATPEEAARRVLAVNTTEESWRDAAKLANEYALSTWDWSVVSADFDELLLGKRP